MHEQVLAAHQRLEAGATGFETVQTLVGDLAAAQQQFLAVQAALIQESIAEVAALDGLLIPVIALMRRELDLPFDEAFHRQIVEEGHRRLAGFFAEFARQMQADSGAASEGPPGE